MTEEEIIDLIKKQIIENLVVEVSVTPEPYTDGNLHNIRVEISYDGTEVTSYGDTINVPQNFN